MAQEPKLKQNSRGYWEIRYAEKDPQTGEWITRRVSTRTTDRPQAEAFKRAWLAEGLKELSAKTDAPNPKSGLTQIIEDYVASVPGQAFNLRNIKRYVESRGDTIDSIDMEGGAVWSEDYTALRLSLEIAPGTIRRELGAFKAALSWACERKVFEKVKLPAFKLPPDGQAREVFLLEDEEDRFYKEVVGTEMTGAKPLSRIARFVALALDTAARKYAIETLTWDRVDLKARTISYRDPLVRVSRKRRSVVPISSRLLPVLVRAHQERTSEYVLGTGGSVRSAWETLLCRRELAWAAKKDLHIHDLRRTWATLAARAGVELWDIAGVLGDTLSTVSKHYAHHRPDHLRGAVDARFKDKA
jgi:integrase